jgi:4-hydroxybenzoate polyprenyltransferase
MFNKAIDFLKLIRFNNLLIIGLTQTFAYYFLSPSIRLSDVFSIDFILLLLSTFLVAGAGYIINDYMDVMLDLVNKPDKVIVGKSISRRWAMLLHFGMNFLAIIFAYQINKTVAILVLTCAVSLWIYSQFLKKNYLVGNLMVAFLTCFTLWIIYFFDPRVMLNGIWVYSIFAFSTTLFREIVKDTEDMRGDSKFKCRTMPIVLGVRKTRDILIWIQAATLALTLAYCTFFGALSFSSNKIFGVFIMYMMLTVLIPMFILIWLTRTADVKADYSRLSLISKLIMLTGIVSMIFWRF